MKRLALVAFMAALPSVLVAQAEKLDLAAADLTRNRVDGDKRAERFPERRNLNRRSVV